MEAIINTNSKEALRALGQQLMVIAHQTLLKGCAVGITVWAIGKMGEANHAWLVAQKPTWLEEKHISRGCAALKLAGVACIGYACYCFSLAASAATVPYMMSALCDKGCIVLSS